MPKLIAVETSGALCSVAIHVDGNWAEDTQNVARLHNQVLLRQIDALARRVGIAPRDLDLVAFGAGPGSFTGVRIAAATAQALALASGAPVAAVSSSHALALAALPALASSGAPGVVTVVRSRRDAHYLAAWAIDGAALRLARADALHQGLDAPELADLRGWPGIGDLPPWWSAAAHGAEFIEGCAATAVEVGRLALALHASGAAVAPEAALPVYVAGDSPWKPAAVASTDPDAGPRAG